MDDLKSVIKQGMLHAVTSFSWGKYVVVESEKTETYRSPLSLVFFPAAQERCENR